MASTPPTAIPTQAVPPDTTRLQAMALAYQQSAALMAAVELDLFTAVSQGARDIAAIAAKIGIAPRQAERLVTVLTASKLLEKSGETYANAADVERFLVKGSPRYAGPWILFTKPRWDGWGDLANRLRDPQEKKLGVYQEFTVADARKYHEATYSIGMGAARRFCKQVDLSGRKLLLDLGGGSGAYSIVATEQFPGLKAIVLDLPPVIEVTKEFVAQNKAADRVSTLAGDFTVTEFPAGVDAVLMASNLPQYSPALIALVIAKAFAALKPGGEMHLVGEALNDDRTGPLSAALWGLGEAIWGSTGVAHSEADCRGYFRAAGFVDIGVAEFIPGVLSRIHGRKPNSISG